MCQGRGAFLEQRENKREGGDGPDELVGELALGDEKTLELLGGARRAHSLASGITEAVIDFKQP